jgi:hypothetical protein
VRNARITSTVAVGPARPQGPKTLRTGTFDLKTTGVTPLRTTEPAPRSWKKTGTLWKNGTIMSTLYDDQAPPAPHIIEHTQDAYRAVLIAVQRALAANWDDDQPRIAVIERNAVATVYVSTARVLESDVRLDIRGAVRAALAPYTALAPSTNVVYLRRVAA